jgi:NADPH2:quinone reductase
MTSLQPTLRAILRQQFGGPKQLLIQHVSHSETRAGARGDRGQAFGLNHAETYMRKGDWGDVVTVSGIECMGVVKADADRKFTPGQWDARSMAATQSTRRYRHRTSYP